MGTTETSTHTTALNQLYWACRRGMLELDLLLIPFLKKNGPSWTSEDMEAFAGFLKEEDQDLLAWLLTSQPPPTQHEKWVSQLRLTNLLA